MGEVTHFVPVGFTKETLIESIRRHPVSKVILVLGDKPERSSEQKARRVAKQVKDALGSVPCEEVYVDSENVSSAALFLIDKIKEHKADGREVLMNLSGSLRSIGLAAYIAALVTGTKTYVGIPSYEGDDVTGIEDVVDIPIIPVRKISKEKIDILKILAQSECLLEDIVDGLNPKLKKDQPDYANEKSRLSHHLKDLKRDGFIETDKDGRNLKVKLTVLGRIYLTGLDDVK